MITEKNPFQVSAGTRPLRNVTEEALDNYFASLNGSKPSELYSLVIQEVEAPLCKAVMNYTKGNQSKAAEMLGINRGTLRKKLRIYGLLG